MACFKPIDVPKKGYTDLRVTVACGRCIGCRLDKRREWRDRLIDEAKLHLWKWFLTLTYDDDHLPRTGTLVKRHAQLWQKRLRKARPDDKVRFFTVGEYGDITKRPHYHSIVFGTDFPDKRKHSWSGDHSLYVSDELDRLWGLGHCWIGTVTEDSAGYVAQYVTKKVTGQLAETHYTTIDPFSGEVVKIEPEFALMSRKPGIGAGWYEQYKADYFPSDTKVVKGRPLPVPKYYADKLKAEDPDMHKEVKDKRVREARKRKGDSTPERLAVREEVARARLAQKRRKL